MNTNEKKKFILGQYFTREKIAERLIELILEYRSYDGRIRILEPSLGTGNFIKVLERKQFDDIIGCEIDPALAENPSNFFFYPIEEKFDLIVGNPPFTKYNLKESYYYVKNYYYEGVNPTSYLPQFLLKKEKLQIENAFILKSIKHLKDKNSTIGFILPLSFFIAGKNREVKLEIIKKFSTLIIFQNGEKWFDEPIPCCFAILTNIANLKNKAVILYEDGGYVKEILDINDLLTKELIPKAFFYRKNTILQGTPLSHFLFEKTPKYEQSYLDNNVSAANILEKFQIPANKDVSRYDLAIVRVGNSSVGKAGLINIKDDVLNAMFYVFKFKEQFDNNKSLKEKICGLINLNQEYFKNITFRVGSKSIKKNDILDFKIEI